MLHDDAFAQLLDLIPAKFYVPVDEEQMDTKYQKNKHTKSQKQQEAEERKAKTQAAKRAKVRVLLMQLDPDNVKSVQEIQQDRRRRLEEGDDLEFDGDAASDDDEDNEVQDEDMEEEDEEDDDDDVDEDDNNAGDDQNANADEQPTSSASRSRRATVAELRERLHNKIEMLHRKRNPNDAKPGDGPPSTKQELMEERRRQRGELRDRRRRERKEARRQAKDQASAKDASRGKADVSGSTRQAGLLVGDAAAPERSVAKKAEPESRLNFSHVDFGLDSQRKNKYALPSDPKAALAALEARKRREESRVQKQVERGQDEEQAREAAEEAERWGKAMAAAEGVRIRDNEHLLKQTIKRREKSKAKSTKAWYVAAADPPGTTGAVRSRKPRRRNRRSAWTIWPRAARRSVLPERLQRRRASLLRRAPALRATAARSAARRAARAAHDPRSGSSAEIDFDASHHHPR